MKRVLVAGAGGHLGRHVVAELSARGHRARALVRDPGKRDLAGAEEVVAADLSDPEAPLAEALEGVDVVFSAAGQSCTMQRAVERASFRDVDLPINRALLAAARAAGVQRFAYVAVLGGERLRHLDYVAAHEDFVGELAASGLDRTVIRANGFFYSYLDMLQAIRRGPAILFGDGSARSNPIHEADLAVACVEAIERGLEEVDVGGPETLTRREEAELAFAAIGKKPRLIRLPAPLLGAAVRLLRPRDRRRAEMLEFIAAIGRTDMLAPAHGERRLGEYLESS
jgi:uncharacterized protein YbjT (DUF2867 family)